jgi:hypothetical protein
MRIVMKATVTAAALSLSLGAGPAIAKSPRPLFRSDEVLNLTLSGPISDLSRKAGADAVPGVLKVDGATPETLPVMLATRGTTRRLPQLCAFPPLRVEFAQKPPATSIFKGQRQLKLVTHCQSAERYEQGVILEYEAYRLYNALTPEGFNVRLAKVNYVSESGRTIASRFGFFIEDIRDVARRNGQKRLRGVKHISASQLDPDAAARFALFEYMISNLDWAMTDAQPGEDCCHNSRLLTSKDTAKGLIPVHYDFDYSGLVDAPYAVPPDSMHLANVRVRRYRGFCLHNAQAQALAADLVTRRTALTSILDRQTELSESYRDKAKTYLGDFFDELGSPPRLTQIMDSCLR